MEKIKQALERARQERTSITVPEHREPPLDGRGSARSARLVSSAPGNIVASEAVRITGTSSHSGTTLANCPDPVVSNTKALMTAAVVGTLSSAVASLTPRRSYATVAIIAVFLVPNIVASSLVALETGLVGQVAAVLSPPDVLDGINAYLFDTQPDNITVRRAGIDGHVVDLDRNADIERLVPGIDRIGDIGQPPPEPVGDHDIARRGRDPGPADLKRARRKDKVALLMGVICGLVAASLAIAFGNDPIIGLALGSAMAMGMSAASLLGSCEGVAASGEGLKLAVAATMGVQGSRGSPLRGRSEPGLPVRADDRARWCPCRHRTQHPGTGAALW